MKTFRRFLLFMALFSVCTNSSYAQTDQAEITLWETVRDSKKKAELETYLKAYPDGKFAPIAKMRLKRLTSPTAPADGFEDEVENNRPAASDLTAPDASAPHDCDRLAAHPEDPRRIANGVHWGDLNTEKAKKACGEAVAEFPDELRFKYQLGRVFHKSKSYETAMDFYSEAANSGYVWAMLGLAHNYSFGDATEKNFKLAYEWLLKAAKAGSGRAMARIGGFHESGRAGLKKDNVEAFRWYERAALKGDREGMQSVANRYLVGNGVNQNPDKAREWFLKLAAAGHTWYLVDLGNMYYYGQGVKIDYSEALKFYNEAIDAGEDRPILDVAKMLDQGLGTLKDRKRATELVLDKLKANPASASETFIKAQSEFSKSLRHRIHQKLKELGHYSGDVDGEFGENTRQALESYAKEEAKKRAANISKQSAKNSVVQEPKPSTSEAISADHAEDLKDLEHLD